MLRTTVSAVSAVFVLAALGLSPAMAQDQGKMLDQALAAATADAGNDDFSLAQVPASSSRWEGFYAGFYAGTATGVAGDGDGPLILSSSLEGWLLGGALGYDIRLGSSGFIAGLAGDLGWSNLDTGDGAAQVGLTGSVRGRVGYDAEQLLPYLTAGLAVANASFASPDGLESVDGTQWGWTAGIGLEAAVDDNWSIDVLYRYSDYGTVEYAFTSPTPATAERSLTTHQVTIGLNYAF